ncbi:MAG: T9SS type A sorting domain-containing protein, partial [Saprospiraceae bacterium]
HDIKKMSNGDLILAVQYDSVPGHPYTDSLSIVFLDSSGSFKKSILVVPPYPQERIDFECLLLWPNDDFLIGFTSGECDVSSLPLGLIKYDASGQMVWARRGLSIHGPDDILLSEDQSILIIAGNRVYDVSKTTGDFSWDIPFTSGLTHIGKFVANNGNIIYYDQQGIHYAKLDSSLGQFKYRIISTKDIDYDYNYFKYLSSVDEDKFFTYSKQDGGIIRFDTNFEFEFLIPLSSQPKDLLIDTTEILILSDYLFDYNNVSIFRNDGTLLKDFFSTLPGLRGDHLVRFPGGLALTGTYGSGKSILQDSLDEYANRFQGWVSYGSLDDLFNARDSANISVTNIQQLGEILIDSLYSIQPLPAQYIYSFHGGDFDVQVTNIGSRPVHSFWVNTKFSYEHLFGICGGGSAAKQIYFDDLTLQPSESMWVKFGDIRARYQDDYPYEFCFWTSGPNGTPDISPADDLYCTGSIVALNEAQDDRFLMYPNPVSHEEELYLNTPAYSKVSWQIISIQGQVLQEGHLPQDSHFTSISTINLLPGMYMMRLGSISKKFVVVN